MAKGDANRAQKQLDVQGQQAQDYLNQLWQNNYARFQPGGLQGGTGTTQPKAPAQQARGYIQPGAVQKAQARTGVDPSIIPGATVAGGTTGTTGGTTGGTFTQEIFNQMFPGESLSHDDLIAKEEELGKYGVKVLRNAKGRAGKIQLPSGQIIDVVQGGESGLNKKQWLAGPVSGGAGGAGGDYPGTGEALRGYGEFSETGGYSPQDIQNIRARGIAPIRAMYQVGADELARSKNLSGGYMPNYAPGLARMQREMSNRIGDVSVNTEAGLADAIRQGRLAGIGGLAQTGLAIGGQGLQSGALQNQLGLGLIDAQIRRSGIPSTAQNVLGNIGWGIGQAGALGKGFGQGY